MAFRDELDRRTALLADGPAARATTTMADCWDDVSRNHCPSLGSA